MNGSRISLTWLLVSLLCASVAGRLEAEQHRATRLGHPARRFAPPLKTAEDLRSRFRDPKLRPDIASILQQWGWKGDLADLHGAALTNEITEIRIPVGTQMPFMSSREDGKPVCLRNVLWAGEEPIQAFAFNFTSKGQRYRCVTPKPCSNFFVEDLGPEPTIVLGLECSAPSEVVIGRPAELCLTVRNTGNTAEPEAVVSVPLAPGANATRISDEGKVIDGAVVWRLGNLDAGASRRVCADFTLRQLGSMSYHATAQGRLGNSIASDCSTKVAGIPAILLELIDLEDPIEIGKNVTYDIKVTNQGSATGTHVRVVCKLPASQQFISGSGATEVHATDSTITFEPLAALEPKAVAEWRVVVKAVAAEDARFSLELTSDQFERPILENESTRQY